MSFKKTLFITFPISSLFLHYFHYNIRVVDARNNKNDSLCKQTVKKKEALLTCSFYSVKV